MQSLSARRASLPSCRRLASRAPGKVSRSRCPAVFASSAADLHKKFGIPGFVEFTEGRGGLPTVVLKHSCGATAEVTLFGACVTSWKQASGDEVLYVRPDAVFDKSKPISGGIPHCFPQFGPGKMQQHGFARNLDWEVGSTSADLQPDERDPEVELVLTDNDYTRAMWPHAFKAVYTVALHGEQLRTDFRVINNSDQPFDFTAALHTYIEVLDVSKAKVTGLKGLTYLDKSTDPNNPTEKAEEREAVEFDGSLLDSVYGSAPDHVELQVGTGAAVSIDSTGWEDVVVWNPGQTMPACFKNFVCVENAKFNTPAVVPAGESWRATATFQVVDIA